MEKLPMEEEHIILGNRDKSIFLWHIIIGKKSMGRSGEKLKLTEKECIYLFHLISKIN